MTKAEILFTQERVGTKADGFWGPLSTEAAKEYLRSMTPKIFPTQREVQSNRSIFGAHGEKGGYTPPQKKIKLPFALHLYGSSSDEVPYLYPHIHCADRMLAVFENLDKAFPSYEEKKKAGILDYYGVYNPRNIRGGNTWSMHAYAIAIDLDATRNGNKVHWPKGAKMSILVMECFAQEGFLCAGAFWSSDGMHSQATSE